jgi:ribosomal protein S20
MKDLIRQRLNEEMNKSDVKTEIKKYMDSSEFKAKVEKIVKDRIKNDKALEDKVVEISKNVLSQLFKQLWVKRSAYINGITNKRT